MGTEKISALWGWVSLKLPQESVHEELCVRALIAAGVITHKSGPFRRGATAHLLRKLNLDYLSKTGLCVSSQFVRGYEGSRLA